MSSAKNFFDDLLARDGMPRELPFEHEQLPEETSTELEKAGVDSSTPTDTFLEMQGRNIFCTGDSIYDCAEKGELASPCQETSSRQ